MAQEQALLGAGDAHVAQPALLLDLVGVIEGALVREEPLLHPDQEDHRELQALGRVQGHEGDGLALGGLIRVRDQGRGQQEGPQRGVVALLREEVSAAHQLLQVLDPGAALDGGVAAIVGQEAALVEHAREGVVDAQVLALAVPVHQPGGEVGEGLAWLGAEARNLAERRLEHGDPALAGDLLELAQAGRAQASARDVRDPAEGRVVRGVEGQAQVGHGVLDLAAVVEASAPDQAVGDPPAHQLVLDGAGLGVGAVEDGDRLGAVAILPQGAADLLDHPAGFAPLVLGLVDHELLALGVVRPELLGIALGVVLDDGVGRLQDAPGRAVVLDQGDDLGVGEVLLELQDDPEVRGAERVDALVHVAHHAQVVVARGQQRDQLVLGLVGVLVLVDQDVLEALAVLVEHVGGGPEEAHRQEEQVVEVQGVLAHQLLLVIGV
ncbi:hypothetical protein D3C86_1134120 [compost metagenome]